MHIQTRRPHRWLAALLTVLAVSSPLSLAQPQKGPDAKAQAGSDRLIDLRPKFKAGDQHRFKINFDAVSKQSLAEAGDPTQTNNQEIGLLLRVKTAEPDGGANLELVYESLKVKMSLPIGEVEFDSAKPKGDYAEFFKPLVGLTLRLTTDKDGNITSVETRDDLPAQTAAIAEQLTGASVVKNIFGPIVSIRKGSGKASIGETWVNEDVIQSPFGDIRVATTNRLKSMRGAEAQIDLKGSFSLAKKSSSSPVEVRDSSVQGQAMWDTGVGMLNSMDMKSKVIVESRPTQDAKPVSITSELTLRVVRQK